MRVTPFLGPRACTVACVPHCAPSVSLFAIAPRSETLAHSPHHHPIQPPNGISLRPPSMPWPIIPRRLTWTGEHAPGLTLRPGPPFQRRWLAILDSQQHTLFALGACSLVHSVLTCPATTSYLGRPRGLLTLRRSVPSESELSSPTACAWS